MIFNPRREYPGSPPEQHQPDVPGQESQMRPPPIFVHPHYKPAGKLTGKTAVITGGDSGIGRAVAVIFAQENANVMLIYLNEQEDISLTQQTCEDFGARVYTMKGDLGRSGFCDDVIAQTLSDLNSIDILVNVAGEQHLQASLEDITDAQLQRTFATNIFSMFYLARAALPFMKPGSTIINTSSVTAYHGNPHLVDYSSTKGAITSFTRSLALNVAPRGIRVNAIAPGPVWTPLIPSTFSPDEVSHFGEKEPLGRPGQPAEMAPAYVYLACEDSSYMTGQVLHINGGSIVNG